MEKLKNTLHYEIFIEIFIYCNLANTTHKVISAPLSPQLDNKKKTVEKIILYLLFYYLILELTVCVFLQGLENISINPIIISRPKTTNIPSCHLT